MRLSVLAILAAAFVAACSHTPRPAPAAEDDGQIVLLIGLDGLRYDAIDRWDAPNLRALAERGTRPERMISVMPTKTFVNFYSIATGLYPEHHGMISNSPWDRAARRHFSTREGSPQDPFWWQGEPHLDNSRTSGPAQSHHVLAGIRIAGRRRHGQCLASLRSREAL